MNPATPGPLTILLVPPPGDTALLADEAGGKVPKLTWCYSEYTDRDFWARPGPGARPHEGAQAAVGLLLVHNGAPVAMGCDRAARWSNHPLIARLDEETALMIARLCARNRDARVVLLRDGREVTE